MQEGRVLFLQALQHRIRHEWTSARRAFEASARLGNADAYWHLFCNDYWNGDCYIQEDDDDDEIDVQHVDREQIFGFLKEGAKLGHPLCFITKWEIIDDLKWEELPHPPGLGAEILWHDMRPDDPIRIFTFGEVNTLKREAEKAMFIHDPWPVVSYMGYLVQHPHMLKMVDPYMIAYAIFIFGGSETVQFEAFDKVVGYKKYTDFDCNSVVVDNFFELSEETIYIIQCVLGQLAHRFGLVAEYRGNACLEVYQECKKRSESAAIAWMGCFRRKGLAHLSRDTATLIAKMIASPIHWCE